jgi:hypothetical protein
MNEALINPEVFTLASQLYVRMRRSGRVVDAVYMAQNQNMPMRFCALPRVKRMPIFWIWLPI